jgi:glycosyltransferase involved in cell wall biosynthesis
MKSLGLYTESIYSKQGNNFYSSDIFILFFRKIFPERNISIIGRLNECKTFGGYKLDLNTTFCGLSNYKNIPTLLSYFPVYLLFNLNRFRKFVNSVDHLFIATPSPVSIFLIFFFLFKKKEVTIFVRQDIRELTKTRYNNFFLYQVANILELIIEIIVKKNPSIKVFVFGKSIETRYRKYSKNVHSIADTRYSFKDVLDKREIKKIDWNKEVKFLFVGRLEKGKGIENIMETFTKFKKTNFSLTIIGDGTLRKSLENKSLLLGINNKIEFVGYIPFGKKLYESIKNHNILILPSFSEGLPQVILEAMSCGVLTIGTNVGGIPDIIDDNYNGFLYDPNFPEELEKLLIRLDAENFDNLLFCERAIETAKKYCNENQAIRVLKEF